MMFDEVDISSILNEQGTTVQAVLLKCCPSSSAAPSTSDTQPDGTEDSTTNYDKYKDYVEQVLVDTCPRRRMVDEILGGTGITFVGQYEDEGIVVVAAKDETFERDINPHTLQPPLHSTAGTIRGDILLLKVRKELEDDDDEQDDEDTAFFTDYTKEEYAAFAMRKNIASPLDTANTLDEDEESEEEDESDDDDNEETTNSEEDSDDSYDAEDEEHIDDDESDDEEGDDTSASGMFNLVLGGLLRKFQEQNGRGPNTDELLLMRSALAEKMEFDLNIPSSETVPNDSSPQKSKNTNSTEEDSSSPPRKRVKFATSP